jgi:hypothetical protein
VTFTLKEKKGEGKKEKIEGGRSTKKKERLEERNT